MGYVRNILWVVQRSDSIYARMAIDSGIPKGSALLLFKAGFKVSSGTV